MCDRTPCRATGVARCGLGAQGALTMDCGSFGRVCRRASAGEEGLQRKKFASAWLFFFMQISHPRSEKNGVVCKKNTRGTRSRPRCITHPQLGLVMCGQLCADSAGFKHSIRYDPMDDALLVSCGRHKKLKCVKTKSAHRGAKLGSGRPLGFLMWWLEQAASASCGCKS